MKNLLVSFGLFGILFVFGLFVFQQTSEAQSNLTASLLDLPAPPPPNPLTAGIARKRADDFYDKNNPPKDDASADELLDYWKVQNDSYKELGYNIKPSERALEKILAAVEKNPETVTDFLSILPEKPEVAALVKRIYDSRLSNQDVDEDENENGEEYRAGEIKKWLTYHSNYFSNELFKQAQQSNETAEYVTNQDEVLALARVDWDKAEPLLARMLGNDKEPVSQTLARWAYYQRALAEGNSADVDKYREQLKSVVENKNASAGMRDLALDALVKEKEWGERDDWYMSLLGDETLHDLRINGQSYTGLTTPIYYAPPGKYTEKMLELSRSDNPAVRNAAVRNLTKLIDEKNPEVIRALLPWLENPDWAKDVGSERRELVSALANFTMPESVPGLIAVLNEKGMQRTMSQMSGMSNGSMSNMAVVTNSVVTNSAYVTYAENHPFRSEAIRALAKQKDVRAVSALRLVLPQVESYERASVVGALIACRGFTVGEQIEALESIVQNDVPPRGGAISNSAGAMYNGGAMIGSIPDAEDEDTEFEETTTIVRATVANANIMSNSDYNRAYNPSELKPLLGSHLVSASEVSDELVAGVVDRIDYLDTRDARLAANLRKLMLNWQGAAVYALLLRDLKNGKAETRAVIKLLAARKELREKQSNDVFAVRGGTAAALGIAACLLEENNEYDAILGGDNADAKTAMLACARLIRAALPVQKVAENLQSGNQTLALAAERYLESEDSIEARRIVLARHPNAAKILGATTYFSAKSESADPEILFLPELFASVTDAAGFAPYYYLYDNSSELRKTEKKLQKEVLETDALLGIYAYDGNFVRIYKDKAEYSWEEDAARYRERTLTAEEFDRLKSHLAANRVDEMAPFLGYCEEGCEPKELLMLGRGGGRRVFVKAAEKPEFFKDLSAMFDEMRKPPAKLHYRLEKDIAGLEVLFADERLQARAVWKNADDLRVLIDDAERAKQVERELRKQSQADERKFAEAEDVDYEKITEERRKRAEQRAFENFAWHKIEKNRLAGVVAQPSQIEFIPPRDAQAVQANSRRWKMRAATVELRAAEDSPSLYKISRGRMTEIPGEGFLNPVITPDGQWAVAARYFHHGGIRIVRINLSTNKEFTVKINNYPSFEPVAFVPSVGKVLIAARSYESEDASDRTSDAAYFLLDAATGTVQPAKGEFRPLAQQTFRPLQPTAVADEFWAAIPGGERDETHVGIYNQKTFTFKSLLKVPQIKFDSMDMWADAGENKIYFVYAGHLLGLPLPKAAK